MFNAATPDQDGMWSYGFSFFLSSFFFSSQLDFQLFWVIGKSSLLYMYYQSWPKGKHRPDGRGQWSWAPSPVDGYWDETKVFHFFYLFTNLLTTLRMFYYNFVNDKIALPFYSVDPLHNGLLRDRGRWRGEVTVFPGVQHFFIIFRNCFFNFIFIFWKSLLLLQLRIWPISENHIHILW